LVFFSFGLPRFDFDLTTVFAAVFFKPDNFFFVFCRTFAIQNTSIGANTLQCGKVPFLWQQFFAAPPAQSPNFDRACVAHRVKRQAELM
jgi:hypothetical protein